MVPQGQHRGRFNAPSQVEMAVVMIGEEYGNRDIILSRKDEKLQRISETHRSYDSLEYPLIFLHGEDGYAIDILSFNVNLNEYNSHKTVSSKHYRLMVRHHIYNHLHNYRKLINKYWVNMYAKIESERLLFIRNNQSKLRAEDYIHLRDAIENDGQVNDIGQLFILPSSFTGGPRYMHEKTMDAMTYVRNFGTPNLFITFTCNPNWMEIKRELKHGQTTQDRHDIIARVFHQKIKVLMNLIVKHRIFGETQCYMYTVEWQKSGLPHVHLLPYWFG
ncbi:unnamed protein product [Macrosiphum euphorbiae]|uniref:Helitron helicase-like domain-containing protein n=1 Tax=Macrosiphum euphorbiae TaxID=13131 RepID=A0AAV0WDA1_9HEMI|nr:unnamed protein product [Macrosiphum euphorbiae]